MVWPARIVTVAPLDSVSTKSLPCGALFTLAKIVAVPVPSFTVTSPSVTVVVSVVSEICAVAVACEKSTASKLPPETPDTVALIEPGSTYTSGSAVATTSEPCV